MLAWKVGEQDGQGAYEGGVRRSDWATHKVHVSYLVSIFIRLEAS